MHNLFYIKLYQTLLIIQGIKVVPSSIIFSITVSNHRHWPTGQALYLSLSGLIDTTFSLWISHLTLVSLPFIAGMTLQHDLPRSILFSSIQFTI